MEITFSDGSVESYEDKPFARGAQGIIYRALDGRHVVKLYKPHSATPQRQQQIDKIIGEYNVVRGDPYWDELYSWPDKRVTKPGLGVRMRLVTGLTSMDHYFFQPAFDRLTPEKRGWWIGRAAAAIKLARAVNRLSDHGLCHSDLSERNIMVDPFDGQMTLLDCDSLVVPGVLPPDVLGTREYMAPELMSGKIGEPSVVTDRHALAVLLYRWLLYKHPLLGPKQHAADPDLDEKLALGERALFIEHPSDRSNTHKRLAMGIDSLTPRVKELFQRAFVDALHDPGRRPTAGAWEEALIEMFDHIVPCSNSRCQQRFFVAQEVGPLHCTLCGSSVDFPPEVPYLKLRRPVQDRGVWVYRDEGIHPRFVVGWPERPLYSWHLHPAVKAAPDARNQRPDPSPQAYLRYDPGKRSWYLQNLAIQDLQAGLGNDPTIQWKPVGVGSLLELKHGAHLLLGKMNEARRAFVEMRRVR